MRDLCHLLSMLPAHVNLRQLTDLAALYREQTVCEFEPPDP